MVLAMLLVALPVVSLSSSAQPSTTVVIADSEAVGATSTGLELFRDSFADCNLYNWVQDPQDAWFASDQRSRDLEDTCAAEVDGRSDGTYNALLILKDPIDLSGMVDATLSFSWFIEEVLDSGEYVALDLWDGSGWHWNEARLNADADAEGVWHDEVIDLSSFLVADFKIRFRATASLSNEDINVDMVTVEGITGVSSTPTPAPTLTPTPTPTSTQTPTPTAATVSVLPATQMVGIDQTFTVDVVIDTDQDLTSADLVVSWPAGKIECTGITATAGESGDFWPSGTVMLPSDSDTTINNTTGTAGPVGAAMLMGSATGTGVHMTLEFVASESGTWTITPMVDSMIKDPGEEISGDTGTEDGEVVVGVVTSTPTPTPTATSTPTPTPDITLYSTADTRVIAQNPSNNYGTETSIGIQAYSSSDRQRGLIQFDLSGVPAGSSITSAVFSAYYYSYYDDALDPAGRTYYLYRNTDSWTETGVTWNSQPGYTTSQGASVVMPGSFGWVSWDVTGIVQTWVDGTPNYGLVMMDSNETPGVNKVAIFYSREYSDPSFAPALVVDYSAAGTTPTPIPTPTPTPMPTPTPTPTAMPTPTPTPQGGVAIIENGGTVTPAGGLVVTEDARVTLEFEAGAFEQDTDVTIEFISCGNNAPQGFHVGDTCFVVTAEHGGEPVTDLSGDVEICVKYSQVDLDALCGDPGSLTFAWYDEDTGGWGVLDAGVNRSKGTVCVTTDHLSQWAVVVEATGGMVWWHYVIIAVGGLLVIGLLGMALAYHLGALGGKPPGADGAEPVLEPDE